MSRMTAVILGLGVVAGLALIVDGIVTRSWWNVGVAVLLLLIILGKGGGRRPDSRAALSDQAEAEWDTDDVRTVIAGADDRVSAVRRLRSADRRLSLSVAVRLVDAGRRDGVGEE